MELQLWASDSRPLGLPLVFCPTASSPGDLQEAWGTIWEKDKDSKSACVGLFLHNTQPQRRRSVFALGCGGQVYQIFDISTDVNGLFNNIYSHGKMFGYILLSENQNHNAYSPILGEKKKKYLPAHFPLVTYSFKK